MEPINKSSAQAGGSERGHERTKDNGKKKIRKQSR